MEKNNFPVPVKKENEEEIEVEVIEETVADKLLKIASEALNESAKVVSGVLSDELKKFFDLNRNIKH